MTKVQQTSWDGDWPDVYTTHPVVLANPGRAVVPYAIFADGVPYAQRDSVLGFWAQCACDRQAVFNRDSAKAMCVPLWLQRMVFPLCCSKDTCLEHPVFGSWYLARHATRCCCLEYIRQYASPTSRPEDEGTNVLPLLQGGLGGVRPHNGSGNLERLLATLFCMCWFRAGSLQPQWEQSIRFALAMCSRWRL